MTASRVQFVSPAARLLAPQTMLDLLRSSVVRAVGGAMTPAASSVWLRNLR